VITISGNIDMSDKINIELGHVQLTLLLPLWGRAVETKKKHPVLMDKTASEIIDKINYDFTTISKNIHPVTQFEWIARSIHIDRTINEFLKKHPKGTIVNIGCGLDTTFDRIDNGKLFWYDLDLPDVIELRKNFIAEGERRKFISSSFLDDGWFSQLHLEDNALFIAAGVFYYIEEKQMQEIFNKMVIAFPGSEVIFDAASSLGVRMANQKVIEGTGLDEKSHLKWGVERASDIPKWNNKIEVVREFPMYKRMKKGLSLRDKFAAYMSDRYKIMYMVHLRMSKT
jgi:O-methyltransferase involved in polyketide biosynthesis